MVDRDPLSSIQHPLEDPGIYIYVILFVGSIEVCHYRFPFTEFILLRVIPCPQTTKIGSFHPREFFLRKVAFKLFTEGDEGGVSNHSENVFQNEPMLFADCEFDRGK